MVITNLLLLLLTHTINKIYSQTIDNTPPIEIQTDTFPLCGIAYDDTTALVLIKSKAYKLTQEGKTTEFTPIPSASSPWSTGLYRMDDDHYATICRNTLITIYNKTNNVYNSTVTNFNSTPVCVMKKIDASNYLILSYNTNNTATMHKISKSANTWDDSSTNIIKDTSNNEIMISYPDMISQLAYDIEYINTGLLLFTYGSNIIGINHNAIQITNTATLTEYLPRLFRLNDATVLVLAIKSLNKITINTVDYTSNTITLKDERVIDSKLSTIATYTIAKMQDNIIELFCLGYGVGQSFIHYDHISNQTITHIKYTNVSISYSYFPIIIIFPSSISMMLLFKNENNRNNNYMIIPTNCHAVSFNADVNVLLSYFPILNMKSIIFYDINSTKNPPTFNGNVIESDNNYLFTSTDSIRFNNHSICKYQYSINQQTDKCDITVNGCKLLCDIPCDTCQSDNLSKCTSCVSGYYYYEDIPSGTLTGCYGSCKELSLPLNLFQDEDSMKCYKNCSEINKKNNLKNNSCVDNCDSGFYHNSTSNNCESKCVCLDRLINNNIGGGEYDFTLCGIVDTSECKECGLLVFNKTNTCVKECPICYKADLSDSYCVIDFSYFPTVHYDHIANICIDECGGTNYNFTIQSPCSNTCTPTDCCHICKPKCDNIDEKITELHPSTVHNDNTSYVFYDTSTDNKDLPKNMSKIIIQNECEKILREFYGLDDSDYLIIAAENTYNESRLTNQFHYSFYLSNGTKCDISLCNTGNDSKIIIQVPINTTNEQYQKAKDYGDKGIDIYQPNNPFFTDKCYPFTSSNNRDISLKDRNTDILKHPDNVCAPECNYIGSNFTTNEVSCECTQSKKDIFTAFTSSILEANYEVVLCYKLVFTWNIFSKGNIGHYCGLVMIALLIIDYGVFICRNITGFNQTIDSMHRKIISRIKQSSNNKTNPSSNPSPIILNNNHPNSHRVKEGSDSSKKTLHKTTNHSKYSDEQLDNQPFKEAYENDKRSFLRMLWSSTKSVQPIIYIFVKSQAALNTIKIASFLLSLMLDFALNAFFYSDKYISQAYNKGTNNSIIDTLPVSCYSYCVGILVNLFFNFLASFESMFASLEKQKNTAALMNLSKKYIRRYKIKLSIFIPMSLVFGVGYWYYMSAFCAVYINSQDQWLNSCWTSFGISIVISEVISFIIALLRYYGLKKNWSCCFFIIKILSLFF